MTPACPNCDTHVDADNDIHDRQLIAVGATLLCTACDEADIDARQAATVAEDAASMDDRVQRVRALLGLAGVPQMHADAAVDFQPRDTQKEADTRVRWWARDGGILVLAGPPGTGKTTLAARGALRTMVGAVGRPGRPVTWRSTAAQVSGMWANDPDTRAVAERLLYHGTGALILDDLDVARTTPAALETLGELVNRWYAAQQPLLVTTNAEGPEALVGQYGKTGERIVSRLATGRWEDVVGPDLRKATG